MRVPLGDPVTEKRNYTKIGATNRNEWTEPKRTLGIRTGSKRHCRVEQQQITVFEERTAQPMTDGTTEYGEWHVVHTVDRWVLIVNY